ncbi:MAG: hypothetical protein IPO21_05160 [Bacteroidales bacterium]|nr:hypothetical protein [Bacteroidales bacterium]
MLLDSPEGLIVISGCAHSGICNIIDYAKKVGNSNKVLAVIGGFHLKEKDTQTIKTIEYFKNNDISALFPMHCTEFEARVVIYNDIKFKTLKSGSVIEF